VLRNHTCFLRTWVLPTRVARPRRSAGRGRRPRRPGLDRKTSAIHGPMPRFAMWLSRHAPSRQPRRRRSAWLMRWNFSRVRSECCDWTGLAEDPDRNRTTEVVLDRSHLKDGLPAEVVTRP